MINNFFIMHYSTIMNVTVCASGWMQNFDKQRQVQSTGSILFPVLFCFNIVYFIFKKLLNAGGNSSRRICSSHTSSSNFHEKKRIMEQKIEQLRGLSSSESKQYLADQYQKTSAFDRASLFQCNEQEMQLLMEFHIQRMCELNYRNLMFYDGHNHQMMNYLQQQTMNDMFDMNQQAANDMIQLNNQLTADMNQATQESMREATNASLWSMSNSANAANHSNHTDFGQF